MLMKRFKIGFFVLLLVQSIAMPALSKQEKNTEINDREYWVSKLTKVSYPVLNALSKGELKKSMHLEMTESSRVRVAHLEAFGRLIAGIAPWLELGVDSSSEGKLRSQYIRLSVRALENAVDPDSPDFMNFTEGSQPLVDAAFLAHGLLRAPSQLWGNLSEKGKTNLLKAFKSTRNIVPNTNNWLLFSAIIEAALLEFDGSWDRIRVDYALNMHQMWYKGDGAYGDGPSFHWDYYNSYVIQPMLLEVLRVAVKHHQKSGELYDQALARAGRFAAVQERMASTDGSFPAVGRSLVYRGAAFQTLAQVSLWRKIPEELAPAQVRKALTAVLKKTLSPQETFDKDGWLRIGLCGYQPRLAEYYITTGSLYLCSTIFLPLGLPAADRFWTDPPQPFTAEKVWGGKDVKADHAIEE